MNRKRKKIALKILLPFVTLFAIIIISFTASMSDFVNKKAFLITQKEVEGKLNMAKIYLNDKKVLILNEMKHLSTDLGPTLLAQGQLPLIRSILKSCKGLTDQYFIQLMDPEGNRITGACYFKDPNNGSAFINLAREYMIDEEILEKVFIKACDDDAAIEVLMPIIHDTRFIGYIFSHHHLSCGFCEDMSRCIGSEVYFFSRHKILTSSNVQENLENLKLPHEIIQRVSEEKKGVVKRIYIGKNEHIAGFLPLINSNQEIEGVLMIPIDNALARKITMGVVRSGVIYGLMGFIVLSILGWLIAKGITKPLLDLIKTTQRIGKGDLDIFIRMDSDDEINELASAFNKMVKDLKKTTVSRNYVDNIIKSMTDALIVVDCKGKIKKLNNAACDLVEYKSKDIIGRPIKALFGDKEGIPFEFTKLNRQIDGSQIKNYETEITTSRGEKIPVLLSASVMTDSEGKMVCTVFTAKDISELKQAEKALLESEKKYRGFIENFKGIAFQGKLSFEVIFFHGAVEEITGYKEEEFTGDQLKWHKIIHPDDFTRLCESGSVNNLRSLPNYSIEREYRIIRKDGEIRWLKEMIQNICDDSGKPFLLEGMIYDVTEYKRMEDELAKAQKLESIGVLAGGIAHDFNNILTAILGNITLAKFSDSQDESTEILAQAERSVERAERLTHQLLTFSKGGVPIKKVASIREIIKESADFALRGSNVKSNCKIPGDIWPVEVDEGQINQVLNNLIINADQAMPEGGMIDIHVENMIIGPENLLPLNEGRYIRIDIEDHGKGVPEENIEKIFDPYFTTKQKGNGLGLAIAYSIIKKHSGHIAVDSQIDRGTIFHIYLPASQKALLPKKAEQKIPLKGSGRILVMDDEKVIRDLAERMLRRLGYEVCSAGDGAEAIRLYKEAGETGQPFDAVILDLTVSGGMGGKEALKKLLEIDPEVKAIVSSGYSNDPVMAEYRLYGFCDIISKPYEINEISKILYDVVTERKIRKQSKTNRTKVMASA